MLFNCFIVITIVLAVFIVCLFFFLHLFNTSSKSSINSKSNNKGTSKKVIKDENKDVDLSKCLNDNNKNNYDKLNTNTYDYGVSVVRDGNSEKLVSPVRNGFTAVEWGGTLVK